MKGRKKVTAIMPRNTGMPQTLLVSSLSALSVSRSCFSLCSSTSDTTSPIKSYFWLIISDS